MKQTLLAAMVVGCLCSGIASAASISGKIVDQVTNMPITENYGSYEYSNAYATLYRYDEAYGYWNYYTSFFTDTSGQFSFKDLSAGQYAVYSNATGYSWEYYNNVRDWNSKKSLVLTAARNLTLQDIKLTPYPLYIKSIAQSVYQLPNSGGNVDFTIEIVNNKAVSQNLKLWVTSYTNSSEYSYYAYSPVTKTPLNVTLAPGSNTVTLPINIPSSYVDGSINLYINLGKAYGNPVAPISYAFISKGGSTTVAAKTAPTTARPVVEEIPLRIADDGTVLLKGPRPQ